MFPQKSAVDVGSAKMSLADRMKILKDKEEQWKDKGKGAANDSVQFTVAGRMAKKGTSSLRLSAHVYSARLSSAIVTLVAKPHRFLLLSRKKGELQSP